MLDKLKTGAVVLACAIMAMAIGPAEALAQRTGLAKLGETTAFKVEGADRDDDLLQRVRAYQRYSGRSMQRRMDPSKGWDSANSDRPKSGRDKPHRRADNDDGPPPKKPHPRKDKPSKPDRPDRPERSEKPPVQIVCNGGNLRNGACVCPSGHRLRKDGARRFECDAIVVTPPPRKPPVDKPPVIVAEPEPKPRPGRPPIVVRAKNPIPVVPLGLAASSAASGGGGPPRLPPPLAPAIPPSGPIPTAQQAQIAAAGGEVMPREIIVSIAANAPPSAETDMARANSWVILDRAALPQVGIRAMRCRVAARRPVQEAVARARTDARTAGAQANYIYRPSQGAGVVANPGELQQPRPNVPATDNLQYSLTKLGIGDAHGLSTGRGTRIAIIDTGIDANHPDLAGAGVETFDALGSAKPEPGTHGTAIAGIIAARGATQGVAPSATLMSVRAFPADTSKEPQMTTSFVLLKAMEWSLANGARVINLSLAGPRDPLMEKAVAAAAAKGVIMIAAAGNNGDKAPPAFPAAYRDVIAVTAIDARDQLYTRANHGDYIAVAAPGVDVLAPIRGKGHNLHSGTSFAAAHVSGIVALLLERNPGLTADAARRALVESAVDLGALGRDDSFGAGRTSAAAALRWEAKP